MTRWLVRVGYDGEGFAGWARQPGRRTVEGTLREAIPRIGVAPTTEQAGLEVASRTDRGVSARANAMVVESPLSAAAVLRALNGTAADIFCTAIAPVPEDFSPRSATCRWYRYFEPAAGRSISKWRMAAARVHGEIDVRSFARGLPPDPPIRRMVDSVRVRRSGRDWLVIDVRAPSFVWGMIRKIIAALRAVDRGTLSLDRLDAALRGQVRLTLPLAEPERLVLWEVQYPIPWTREWNGPNRAQTLHLQRILTHARLRGTLGQHLPGADALGPVRGNPRG